GWEAFSKLFSNHLLPALFYRLAGLPTNYPIKVKKPKMEISDYICLLLSLVFVLLFIIYSSDNIRYERYFYINHTVTRSHNYLFIRQQTSPKCSDCIWIFILCNDNICLCLIFEWNRRIFCIKMDVKTKCFLCLTRRRTEFAHAFAELFSDAGYYSHFDWEQPQKRTLTLCLGIVYGIRDGRNVFSFRRFGLLHFLGAGFIANLRYRVTLG